jgi:glycosyltransferase involved in cell wall biosynthesis
VASSALLIRVIAGDMAARPLALFITYYFPPSGGPGVQRVLKFVKYLPEFGWEPVVLTVRQGAYPSRDPSLEGELGAGLRIYRTPSWDPFALYARWTGKRPDEAATVGFASTKPPDWRERWARWIRANCFLPDARLGWVPFAIRAGRQILRQLPVRVLVTSGPPHSTHLIGRALHRRFHLPWVADFRDPWTGIDYYAELPMSRWARRLDAALERAVLREASAVVTVGPSMARHLQERYSRFYHVIPNGFDESDFPSPAADPEPGSAFRLLYVGTLNPARNPEILWEALRRLRAEGIRLELELVGLIDGLVQERLAQLGLLGDLVRVRAYVPHEEAVRLMCGADGLLLLINRSPGAEGILTGKIYEYLASGRPVLGIGPPEGDAALVLRQSGAGVMVHWDDLEGLIDHLRAFYEAWRSGRPIRGASREAALRYSRRMLAGELVLLLDSVLQRCGS